MAEKPFPFNVCKECCTGGGSDKEISLPISVEWEDKQQSDYIDDIDCQTGVIVTQSCVLGLIAGEEYRINGIYFDGENDMEFSMRGVAVTDEDNNPCLIFRDDGFFTKFEIHDRTANSILNNADKLEYAEIVVVPNFDGYIYNLRVSGTLKQPIVTQLPGYYISESTRQSIKDEAMQESVGMFANVLKGKQKGEAVKIEDVSPLTDTIKVKAIGAKSVKKQGKNVLPYPYYNTTKETNGLTFTDNGDGSITVNGTSTGYASFYLTSDASYANINDLFEDGKTYVFCNSVSGLSYVLPYKDLETGSYSYCYGGQTFTVDKSKYMYQSVRVQSSAGTTCENVILYPQIEIGTVVTEFEPYKAPTTYTVSEDGTVEGVTALYPTTTLVTDTQGVVLECEYNRDINKAFAELQQAIISLGGNV